MEEVLCWRGKGIPLAAFSCAVSYLALSSGFPGCFQPLPLTRRGHVFLQELPVTLCDQQTPPDRSVQFWLLLLYPQLLFGLLPTQILLLTSSEMIQVYCGSCQKQHENKAQHIPCGLMGQSYIVFLLSVQSLAFGHFLSHGAAQLCFLKQLLRWSSGSPFAMKMLQILIQHLFKWRTTFPPLLFCPGFIHSGSRSVLIRWHVQGVQKIISDELEAILQIHRK